MEKFNKKRSIIMLHKKEIIRCKIGKGKDEKEVVLTIKGIEDGAKFAFENAIPVEVNIKNAQENMTMNVYVDNACISVDFTDKNTLALDLNEIYSDYIGVDAPIGLRLVKFELMNNDIVVASKQYNIMIYQVSSINSSYSVFENKSPYISTYHLQSVYEPGEDIIVDYYLDDYDYTYNRLRNTDFDYTVYCSIDGKEEIVVSNKAGDNSINLGSFDTEGERILTIKAHDQYNRWSHVLHYDILVKNSVSDKVYEVTAADLSEYNIVLDDLEEIVYQEVDVTNMTDKVTEIKAILEEVANSHTVPEGKYSLFLPTDSEGNVLYYKNASTNSVVRYSDSYDAEAVEAQAYNNNIGLDNLIKDKVNEGFNVIKLLPGIYRVSYRNIDNNTQLASLTITTDNTTLDLNGSTIKMNQFTGNSCFIVALAGCKQSHIINGTIEGDYYTHDYVNSPDNSEWCSLINFAGGCKYCTFDNLIIKNSAGYGFCNGIANVNGIGYTTGSLSYYPNYQLGDIDIETGELITNSNRQTSDFNDVSKCGTNINGDIEVCSSLYLGYQGNGCGNWNIKLSFYDENKNYLGFVHTYQYRRTVCPKGTKYIRLTNLANTSNTGICACYWNIPTNCAFKNMEVVNTRGTGSANSAMRNMLFENINVTCCGQNVTPTGMDFEDGWDMMQDMFLRNVNFYQTPGTADFLTCAGHNLVVEDMKHGGLYFYGRTRNICVRNCNIKSFHGIVENIVRSGDRRVINNIIAGGISPGVSADDGNTVYYHGGTFASVSSGVFFDSTIQDFSGGTFNRCLIKPSGAIIGYINTDTIMHDCVFENESESVINMKFNSTTAKFVFENCEFKGAFKLNSNNNFQSGTFTSCIFEDVSLAINSVVEEGNKVVFQDCDIVTKQSPFIHYGPYAYTQGSNTNTVFNNCNIVNECANSMFVNMYAAPNGYIGFINCNINNAENGSFKQFADKVYSPENVTDITIDCTGTNLSAFTTLFDTNLNNKLTTGELKFIQ